MLLKLLYKAIYEQNYNNNEPTLTTREGTT